MKKQVVFALNTLGWVMLFAALLMGCIRSTGYNPSLYWEQQLEAGILDYAGISEEDLLLLDVNLANYLFGKYDSPNAEIPVFGQNQPAFNEKELIHLEDCRKLLAPTMSLPLNGFLAIAGVVLALFGKRKGNVAPVWLASGLILAPIAILALWAAIDFSSAFTFFHKILFTNDLWLLNPDTDLLIRICPASMFADMGLGIALRAAAALLGLPLVLTLLCLISEKRKKEHHENAEL